MAASNECTALTRSVILQTKCGKCKLLCSVAPVSEMEGLFYCGRCYSSSTPSPAFEKVAEEVCFPCVFGCGDLLPWGYAKNHENLCQHKEVECPFIDCGKTNKLSDLYWHIYHVHRCWLNLSAPFVGELPKASYNLAIRLHCLEIGEFKLLFFIKLKRNLNICYFKHDVCLPSLQQIRDRKTLDDLKLKLKIENLNTNVTIIKVIHGTDIHMYDDKRHCLSCLYMNCEKKDHENNCDWMHSIPINIENMECKLAKDMFYTISTVKSEIKK